MGGTQNPRIPEFHAGAHFQSKSDQMTGAAWGPLESRLLVLTHAHLYVAYLWKLSHVAVSENTISPY